VVGEDFSALLYWLIEPDPLAERINDIDAPRVPVSLVQPRTQVTVVLLGELAVELFCAGHLAEPGVPSP
jgi:hypothetical protein